MLKHPPSPVFVAAACCGMTLVGAVGCALQNKADPQAFARATSLAIASVQGPRAVDIHASLHNPAPYHKDALDPAAALHFLDEGLASALASTNDFGVPVVDEAGAYAAARVEAKFHLKPINQAEVGLVPVAPPAGVLMGKYLADHYATKETHLIIRSRDTGKRLGQVARAVHSDLALWVDLKCSLARSGAHAAVTMIVADNKDQVVGEANGSADVDMSSVIQTLGVTPDQAGAPNLWCTTAVHAAIDAALERLAGLAKK